MSFHRIKPILFNTEMVRAILDGRKSVTRRLPSKRIEDKWYEYDEYVSAVMPHDVDIPCVRYNEKAFYEQYPPYQIGDILYVRETWCRGTDIWNCERTSPEYFYKAEFRDASAKDIKWRPSIHMPKEAARIWLKVTDVRVERLQDITEEKAVKEGAIDNRGFIHSPDDEYDEIHTAREHFKKIWDSTINKKDIDSYGWDANPWVFVVSFEKIEKEKL